MKNEILAIILVTYSIPNYSQSFDFKMNKTKQTNSKIEHISLWKMSIQKI